MIREVTIEDKTVEINSSAGWLYKYRSRFGHDILPDLMPILESVLAAGASVLQESGGEINEQTIMAALDNDALVDAFIKVSGMETLTVLNIFWAMAANADKSIASPEEYFNQFDVFPMDVIVPALFTAVVESSVSSKNAERLLTKIRELSPSDWTQSRSQESIEG
ncbi:MAG: hypothetical protein IKF22_08640 [Lachnospiraceae bacterium]|nr:hypothetical protein [Lachnospiraceae bacterium]